MQINKSSMQYNAVQCTIDKYILIILLLLSMSVQTKFNRLGPRNLGATFLISESLGAPLILIRSNLLP